MNVNGEDDKKSFSKGYRYSLGNKRQFSFEKQSDTFLNLII